MCMDNREVVAYAVDVDTGKVTWVKYNEPWKENELVRSVEDYYLDHAIKCAGEC